MRDFRRPHRTSACSSKFFLLLVAAVGLAGVSGLMMAQQRDALAAPTDTLASIGPRAVTARDLIERIELMPWRGKDNPGTIDSAKIRALQSLVAEQILAMEASAQGLVDDSTYRAYARYVEKLMVRDELYRREVREKVSVSPEEVAQGLEIRRRKEAVRAAVYVGGVLEKQKARARPAAFEMLAATLHDLFEKDSVLYRNASGYRLDKVADAAKERLAPYLRDVLVDLDEGALTIQDVLEGWKNFDFLIPTLERRSFLAYLNGAIREAVAREYLTREGYRRKLQQSASVRHDVETWMNAWLASKLTRKLAGDVTVSEHEVWSEKARRRLEAYVASAARNYSVTLYYDRLRQLFISPLNLVVKRFIGFGGSMPASPGLVPIHDWVKDAEGVKQILP